MANVKLELPIRTVSELNSRDHWRLRNLRRLEQRRTVYYAWKAKVRRKPVLPCTVKLTRLGPRRLDDDNCQGSFKFCRDVIAELLGVDDADPRIKFEYDQQQSTRYGVVIEVTQ